MLHDRTGKHTVARIIGATPLGVTLVAILTVIIESGFDNSSYAEHIINRIYLFALAFEAVILPARHLMNRRGSYSRFNVLFFDILLFALVCLLINHHLDLIQIFFLKSKIWLYSVLGLLFIREVSVFNLSKRPRILNPAQLFVLSFLALIVFGTVVLLLPNSSNSKLSFLDALFTSTSAVCVTGLVVVDTGSHFTLFGQIVIVFLIQLGGLGIMTFASYFSFFFKGSTSFRNQIFIRNMTNTERVADAFGTLKKIIVFTLTIEAAGALLIFHSLDVSGIPQSAGRVFFSIFHSVSAFCNAGFSTLSDSLFDSGYRHNYYLQLIICGLFITGGIGFPVLLDLYRRFKQYSFNIIHKLRHKPAKISQIKYFNINTRIVLVTTLILLVAGTGCFMLLEYNSSLAGLTGFGKTVTALFSATTPRTAGFNTIDYSVLNSPTLILILLLMWAGASPGSTGGGIKTSTLAIATLSIMSLAKGKERIEMFGTEIAESSIRRAFAIISLSLIVTGAAIFLLTIFEEETDLLPIVFECFSAYSTVGLSMGITDSLCDGSKVVLILTMFVGRISMLTIMIAVIHKTRYFKYRFPQEEILIN